MCLEIAALDLRLRRRSVLWYAAGMALYAYLIVAMYPTVSADTSLESLAADNPELLALFGVSGSLTSPTGWLNGNLYANFLPLLVLLVTVAYGGSAIAGQSADGTLGLVATLPLQRRRIVLEKVVALVVLALPLPLVTLACAFAGRAYDLEVGTAALVGTTATVVLLGVDLGLLAMVVGATGSGRGLAVGLTSAWAAASYLVSSLAPVVGWARTLQPFSLFHWAVGDGQLTSGPSPAAYLVLSAVGAALTALVVILVERMDIG
ncbi:MAG: hypothetical protein ABIS35_01700 [Terracoccus sp.]